MQDDGEFDLESDTVEEEEDDDDSDEEDDDPLEQDE